MTDQLIEVPVVRIEPNPQQPRTEFDPVALQELADSIKEHGVIQPLIVYANPGSANEYTLIAGERRWRAATLAGLLTVPCAVRPVPADRQENVELALVENVQRADLRPADEARAYQQLHDLFNLTDEQIGQRVGKARSTVANIRRLAELPAPVLDRIGDGEKHLPLRYARSLIPIARIDPQTAQDIAVSVSIADEENREMEFDERVGDLLEKKGKQLNKAAFDLNWNPKESAVIEGVEHPLPSCTGCEYRLKIDFTEYCARPKCLDAKEKIFAERELVRVSKALGVAVAEKGETINPLPTDPKRLYQPVETVKDLLATKHASLRLVAGSKGSVHHWENEQITSSKIVRLMTTDPEALRKAAGWAEPKKESSGGTMSGRDEYAEQRKKHEEMEERITRAVAIAAPAFDKIWPDHPALLLQLVDMLNYADYVPETITEKLNAQKPSVATCKTYLSCAIISNNVKLNYSEHNALKAKDPIEDLARELKVKLPSGWADPLTPPKPVKAEKATTEAG